MYRYAVYMREFGWTPQQVDEIPLGIEVWLLPIFSAINEAEQYLADKAAKEAQG